MMKIRCVVERITYQNPENGYTILKCRVKDYINFRFINTLWKRKILE